MVSPRSQVGASGKGPYKGLAVLQATLGCRPPVLSNCHIRLSSGHQSRSRQAVTPAQGWRLDKQRSNRLCFRSFGSQANSAAGPAAFLYFLKDGVDGRLDGAYYGTVLQGKGDGKVV